jgi:5'-nucleotidase
LSKCILLIDLDGTVYDWFSAVKARFENSNTGLKLAPLHEWVDYDHVYEQYPEWEEQLHAAMSAKGLYSELKPIPGAIEALKDIEENCGDFIEPFLCSCPEVKYDDMLCHSEKAQAVERDLGRFWTERLILTRDKTLIRGSILIDDKPRITGVLPPVWEHLVYKQPWNAEHGDFRFEWSEWAEFRDEALRPTYASSPLILPSLALGSNLNPSFSKTILTENLHAR